MEINHFQEAYWCICCHQGLFFWSVTFSYIYCHQGLVYAIFFYPDHTFTAIKGSCSSLTSTQLIYLLLSSYYYQVLSPKLSFYPVHTFTAVKCFSLMYPSANFNIFTGIKGFSPNLPSKFNFALSDFPFIRLSYILQLRHVLFGKLSYS